MTAKEVFDKNASLYQQKYMDTGLYHDTFDEFCGYMPQNAQILEIACGPGNITNYLLQKRPDFKILATDIAPAMLELAKKNNPAADFKIMDAKHIDTLTQKYHGIMCGFCLPYLSKEETVKLITDAEKLLLPGGVLYLSTMEDDYARSGVQTSSAGNKMYMYYYQAAYLVQVLQASHLAVLSLQRKKAPVVATAADEDLIIIAGKQK